MPRFDGTGPRGVGPMTGHGEGYCVLEISESGGLARGYAGLLGTPMRWNAPRVWPARGDTLPCCALHVGLYDPTGRCRGSRLV